MGFGWQNKANIESISSHLDPSQVMFLFFDGCPILVPPQSNVLNFWWVLAGKAEQIFRLLRPVLSCPPQVMFSIFGGFGWQNRANVKTVSSRPGPSPGNVLNFWWVLGSKTEQIYRWFRPAAPSPGNVLWRNSASIETISFRPAPPQR